MMIFLIECNDVCLMVLMMIMIMMTMTMVVMDDDNTDHIVAHESDYDDFPD